MKVLRQTLQCALSGDAAYADAHRRTALQMRGVQAMVSQNFLFGSKSYSSINDHHSPVLPNREISWPISVSIRVESRMSARLFSFFWEFLTIYWLPQICGTRFTHSPSLKKHQRSKDECKAAAEQSRGLSKWEVGNGEIRMFYTIILNFPKRCTTHPTWKANWLRKNIFWH